MDIRSIPIDQLLEVNRATNGQLHAALAAAWETHGAQDIDLQLSYLRGTYTIHIIGLVGDAVVFERSILVTESREMPEAQRIVLLLLWIDTIQSRTARAVARGDAAVLARRASLPEPVG